MEKRLLPYPWKITGFLLFFAAIVLSVFYIGFDMRFRVPVFAVMSSFAETRMFVTFRTNFADELILLLMVSGSVLSAFSKERKELRYYKLLRIRAVFLALLWNSILVFLSVLFIYGNGFLVVMTLNLFSLNILYQVFFYFLRLKQRTHLRSN